MLKFYEDSDVKLLRARRWRSGSGCEDILRLVDSAVVENSPAVPCLLQLLSHGALSLCP